MPELARIEQLELCGVISDLGLHRLAECPYLKGLESLDVSMNDMGLDGARALAGSSALPSLRQLSLSNNAIENLGFQSHMRVTCSGAIWSSLDVGSCDIGIDGLRGAAKEFRLRNLTELDLSGNQMDRPAIAVLARGPFSGRLRALHLQAADLNSTAIQPLTDSLAFTGLRTLDLRQNHLTESAAQNLAASPHLANLQRLHLEGNNIGPAGREKLKTRFGAAVTF